jgi:hypothetical protein
LAFKLSGGSCGGGLHVAIALTESLRMKPYILPAFALLCAATMTDQAAARKTVSEVAEHLFISPMGEPFRGDKGRPALIAAWFAQADSNHDGKLTLIEFRADADRFFDTLDVNHDGELDPEEFERYESKVAPEIGVGSGFGGYDYVGGQGAALFGMLDIPQPVASADADFNRGVSRAEFQRAAASRFKGLDFERRGALTLTGLPARPPKIERRKGATPDSSE